MITYYLHIPKTGGISFRGLAQANVAPDDLIDEVVPTRLDPEGSGLTVDSFWEEVKNLISHVNSEPGRSWFVIANIPYGIHRHVSSVVRYATCLREPVDRARSYWRYIHRNRFTNGGAKIWNAWERLGFSLPRILEHPSGFPMVNDQTRLVLGTGQRELNSSHAKSAKELLESEYFFVVDFAHYERDIKALMDLLRWRHREVPTLNVADSDSSDGVPADFDLLVRQANGVDSEVYEWVRVQSESLDQDKSRW